MSSSILIRYGGLAALVGGALFMIAESLSLLLIRYPEYSGWAGDG